MAKKEFYLMPNCRMTIYKQTTTTGDLTECTPMYDHELDIKILESDTEIIIDNLSPTRILHMDVYMKDDVIETPEQPIKETKPKKENTPKKEDNPSLIKYFMNKLLG